jgi:hypothetical protein
MVITCGLLLAGIAFSVTRHWPSASAVVVTVCLPNETFTFSPAPAIPQMLTGFSLCSTMWLLNASATLTSVCAHPHNQKDKTQHIMASLFILVFFFVLIVVCLLVRAKLQKKSRVGVNTGEELGYFMRIDTFG